ILQSAGFLYVTELGNGANGAATVELTARETATALSYLVLGAPPDDELLAAADAGSLADADGREAQVRRLLEDPRAKAQIVRAVREWLGIDKLDATDKDSNVYPMF